MTNTCIRTPYHLKDTICGHYRDENFNQMLASEIFNATSIGLPDLHPGALAVFRLCLKLAAATRLPGELLLKASLHKRRPMYAGVLGLQNWPNSFWVSVCKWNPFMLLLKRPEGGCCKADSKYDSDQAVLAAACRAAQDAAHQLSKTWQLCACQRTLAALSHILHIHGWRTGLQSCRNDET